MSIPRKYINEVIIWKVLIQLLSALSVCHFPAECKGGAPAPTESLNAILHRDLKPENIFLDDAMNAKLGDFGLAQALSSANSYITDTSFVGTPYYMAPEILNGKAHSRASDVWSLGCVLYELTTLR